MEEKGQCHKWKALLLESFFFSHKVEINRYMRKWLKTTSIKAKKAFPDDKALKFMDTKISCEVN